MEIAILNCFDTYEHRADLLASYFRSSRSAHVRIIEGNYLHREKRIRTDKKAGYEFLETRPYKKNLSVQRLYSHHCLAKAMVKWLEEHAPETGWNLLWVLIPANSLVSEVADYRMRHPQTKLVFDIMDLWPESLPFRGSKRVFPLSVWRRTRDGRLGDADQIVTECHLFQQMLPNEIPKKKRSVLLLAHRELESEVSFELIPDEMHLCYLGSINHIIDIPGIGNIIAVLRKACPVVLHIIGDGERCQELIAEAEKSGAQVIWHGAVYETEKKKQIIHQCQYGLNIMKPYVCVGLTMKSLDYFENGLPLINNIHGDTWDYVDECELGINIDTQGLGDSDEVCQRLLGKLILNQLQMIDMQKRVLRFFHEKLTVSAFEKDLERILERIELER